MVVVFCCNCGVVGGKEPASCLATLIPRGVFELLFNRCWLLDDMSSSEIDFAFIVGVFLWGRKGA